MRLKADNFYCFEDFEVNFTYRKKLTKTRIEYEYLRDYPNFRFKKLNIIMGCNASGKTAFGKMLMNIFNFIKYRNISIISQGVSDKTRISTFEIDMVHKISKEVYSLYRLECGIFEDNIRYLKLKKTNLEEEDSYEKAVERLEEIEIYKEYENNEETENEDNLMEIFEHLSGFGWFFCFPGDSKGEEQGYDINVLNIIMKAFDTSIVKITEVEDTKNGHLIYFENGNNALMQNGKARDIEMLSSGTKEAVGISFAISHMLKNPDRPFYIDEKFSHAHSELEKMALNVMIDLMSAESQIFFTTHNVEILEMDLPKHSFLFFSKRYGGVKVTHPEQLKINKNDRSLMNYVKNDVFDTIPYTDSLFEILELKRGIHE